MELDQFTLATVLGIKSLIASVIFYLLHVSAQRVAGACLWALASLFVGLAVLFDAFSVIKDLYLASLLFNIPLICAQILFLFGTAQFVGRPFERYILPLVLTVIALLTIALTLVSPDSSWRAIALTPFYVVANVWMAWVLWRHRKTNAQFVYLGAAAVMVVQAAAALMQAVLFVDFSGIIDLPATWAVPASVVIWINAVLTIVLGSWVLFLLIMFHLVDELKAAVEREERERIARDLHDTVLQTFQGFVMKANALLPESESGLKDALSRCMRDANMAIQEGRDKIASLRATSSHILPLHEYLRMVGNQGVPAGRKFTLRCKHEVCALHPAIQQELCAIGQEAIRNAFRHSNGRHHEVIVEYGSSALVLTIRDDGRGIDAADREKFGCWGVRGIDERARLIHADVALHTAPGAGTTWRIELKAALAYSES